MTRSYGIMPMNDKTIALAQQLIADGETVVIPTDTVYGVVANPLSAEAVHGIFAVKHRPPQKTIQILCAVMNDARVLGVHIPHALEPLEVAFMPGALSLIGEVNDDSILATVREENDGRHTQAVRLPAHDGALKILKVTGPLAASSANLSGREAAHTAQEAYDQLGDTVSLYLDDGATPGPVASTVVAWNQHDKVAVYLREGVIPRARVEAVLKSSIPTYEGVR
ncbi:L-threonylcarbamoyladenylate synthase [Alloscardovia venturai]|uniref:L-threonylcarbamoyladenylate synthase n=1 Tax=Alloscardovia venturai TaxID=1769421 RepID=A0ABW2Y3Q6_9BIFI